MAKIIDIREKAILDECMDWLDEALNKSDIDMTQHIVDCGFGVCLELNAMRIEDHIYEEVDGYMELVEPEYDSYGRVGEIEIYVIRDGEAVDSLTEPPYVDMDELRENIKSLYRIWRK